MEETIELREVIDIILEGKWLISVCTIIAILFAGVFSWFVLEEQYESKAVIQISSGVQDTGIMSNYIATEFTPTIYTQRMQNTEQNKKLFKEAGLTDYSSGNLSVTAQVNTNLVDISYKASSAQEAQQYVQILMDKTKAEMNESVKLTLNQLEQTYLKESDSLSGEIEHLMTQYNDIVIKNRLPEVLILQTIASSQFVLNITESQTNSLSTITGALQNELLQLKAKIDTKSEEYLAVLSKYQSVKTGLNSFKPDPFIRVILEPTLAEGPSSPNKLLNLAIGSVLGLILGMGLVFSRAYWKSAMK